MHQTTNNEQIEEREWIYSFWTCFHFVFVLFFIWFENGNSKIRLVSTYYNYIWIIEIVDECWKHAPGLYTNMLYIYFRFVENSSRFDISYHVSMMFGYLRLNVWRFQCNRNWWVFSVHGNIHLARGIAPKLHKW